MKPHIVLFSALVSVLSHQLKAQASLSGYVLSINNEVDKGFNHHFVSAEIGYTDFYFFNTAIVHSYNLSQDLHESKFFVGIGVGNIIKVQYGYSFAFHKEIFRYKFNLPVPVFKHFDLIQFDEDDDMFPSLGFYAEELQDSPERNWSFGISFSMYFNYENE